MLFCICMHEFSQFGFNDETWLNVRLTRNLEKGTIGCRNVGVKCFVGTKYLLSSFKQTHTFEVPSMALRVEESVWNKKRQKAQPFINRLRYELGRKAYWQQQIGFLRKCNQSDNGTRLKTRSEKRVLNRAISELYGKIKQIDKQVAGFKVILQMELEMPRDGLEGQKNGF